jgi:RND family efflux transporter MFP subunit
MRRNLRIFVAAIVFVVAVILVLHHRTATEPAANRQSLAPHADVAIAHYEAIGNALTVAGIFQPYQEVDVHGKVSGYIRHIYVDIGDRVRKGQTLAVLEVPELEAQVTGAQALVGASRDEITRAEDEVTRTEADYAALHAEYTRLKQASDARPGLVAQQELDNAAAKDRSAEAQIDAAKSLLAASREQLGVSQADRQRVQSMSDYSVITAPFDGVVTMRYADTGALIAAGTAESTNAQPVVRLAQSDLLRLRMPVPEEDVPLIHIGDLVDVTIQATGQKISGTVVRYTRDVSIDTRTMLTEVDVPNPNLSLTPGMYAQTTFHLKQAQSALVVPLNAVVSGTNPYVLIVDANNRIQRRNVTVGLETANRASITGGLNDGDRVITGGQSTYEEGEIVSPQVAPAGLTNYEAGEK